MSSHAFEIALLFLLVCIMIIGLFAHSHYFIRVTNHIKKSSPDRAFQRKDLKIALHLHQGSNFNTAMLFSWTLFIVALAFQYFLTPDIFPKWNYFKFYLIASDSFGLGYFGIAVLILLGILIALFIPQCYSYYLISAQLKKATLLAPVLLVISISSSIYLGTIYPELNPFYWYLGYGAMLTSLILMMAPIVIGYIEEMRT